MREDSLATGRYPKPATHPRPGEPSPRRPPRAEKPKAGGKPSSAHAVPSKADPSTEIHPARLTKHDRSLNAADLAQWRHLLCHDGGLRLTLNILLSFAQFEREIAAAKAKGMWMGGYVPPGYDVRER